MKKLVLVAMMAAVTSLAGAQVQFGAKAGLNLASIRISPSEPGTSFKMAPNFNAGVLAYLPLVSKLGLQPEVMYSAQGSKVSSGSEDGTYHLGYINVPVLVKYKDPSGFFVEAGPQIGFLLNAKVKSQGVSVDAKDTFKGADFSAAFGIGYLSPLNIGIDARYNLGLNNIAKYGDNESAKNSVAQLSIFYMFGHHSK
ncbi:MAG TPA: porin family protein [Chitinophagaceae bacterium]|nr:porin family protein [Chitinophagaceae bacterium]